MEKLNTSRLHKDSIFEVPTRIFINSLVSKMILIIVFSSMGLKAQNLIELDICENCLNEVFNNTFVATKKALPPIATDSASFTIVIPAKDNMENALLYVGDASYIKILDGSKEYLGGRFTPKESLTAPFARYLFPIKLGKKTRELKIALSQIDHMSFTIKPKLIIGNDIEDVVPLYYTHNEPARIVNIICIVLLSLLLLFSIYQALILKNIIYRSYALYLFSVLIFLLLFTDEYLQWHFLLPNNLHQYGAYNIFPQGLIYVLYTEFGIAFLDIKKKYPKIFKVSRIFQILTFCITALHSIYLIFSFGDQAFVYKYFFIFYGVIILFSNYLTYLVLFKIKDNTKWFLLSGSLIIGWAAGYEVYNIFANGSPKPRDFFYAHPSGFMHFSLVEISYIIESLIFLMGINYKSLRNTKENKKLKELIIKQLKEKEQLETEVNTLLKAKLRESQKQLEIEQILSENERNYAQLLKSQLSSLQLQMNPHYLFNSLNSINDFIISKKPQEASEYLALYARMMRNVLKNSDKTFNSLEQELQLSEDYLALEAIRFEEHFEYKIINHLEGNSSSISIPGMIIQPILENAVWHGIMPVERQGLITLSVSSADIDGIFVTIEDNGNGIDEVSKGSNNKSYGLKNIQEKIELLYKIYGKEIKISMSNKKNENGFRVELYFPFFPKEAMA